MTNKKSLFPIFENNPNLVYLDSGASTQRPKSVMDFERNFLEGSYANINRGSYSLSLNSTKLFEESRVAVSRFINCKEDEVVFTKGTTESINLVATGLRPQIKSTDEILVTEFEHHANLVPWQELCKSTGATLKVAPIKNNGSLDLDEFKKLITNNTKVVAITHISNVLGTINPIRDIVEMAKKNGAYTLIDAAQSIAHEKIDVNDIDCDFLCFSSHKMYGPNGVGVLYGKYQALERMEPYQYGGDMIKNVGYYDSTYRLPPHKFEAGTPNISGVITLKSAIDFLDNQNLEIIKSEELRLLKKCTESLREINEVNVYGDLKEKSGIISFTIDNIHPHDVGHLLGEMGICVRTGHHCAMPLIDRLGLSATTRMSLGVYNEESDIDKFIDGMQEIIKFFKRVTK